jgi:hypothetical protein
MVIQVFRDIVCISYHFHMGMGHSFQPSFQLSQVALPVVWVDSQLAELLKFQVFQPQDHPSGF